ncbi:MAG TPA: FtsQ-type POTRA domain-containing protein [Pyrinomonadaceae bacterium]|nr:FtsQ-type POTRA domain-containing protein [Pyrinomonadaceae bacterium]
MREQVITPRAGRGAGGGGKARAGEMVQRPAKRGASSSRAKAGGWRKVLVYFPLAGKIALAVIAGVLLFAGYRAAASAAFFRVRYVDVSGASRASAGDIKAIVTEGAAQTGVWRADLDRISRELKKIPWVREAVVSRVLPDGLRVRITERTPRAVLRTSAGKFVWVDEEAVSLGAASPADQIFMRGWDEDGTEGARAQNSERVEKFLEMTRDWETRGISRRVSEVNLYDLSDVRAQLTGDDAQIEIQLGREDFGNRLKYALDELDERRNTPIGPFILYINVAQGIEKGKDRIAIGVSPDAPNFSAGRDGDSAGPEIESAKVEHPKPAARTATAKPRAEGRKAKEKETVARKDDARNRKKEQEKKAKKDKKDKEPGAARTESRPRRVTE